MAFVFSGLVSVVMNKLLDKAIESIVSILGVKSEIKKLQRSVEKIRLVLVYAESKKIESKAINLWFAHLREVIYDAEDLLDDFHAHKGVVGALLSINREGEIGTRINGKRVFIVLDDIWDADLWKNFLRIPLLVAGARDSRILITTRNKEVAMKMNAVHMHPMTEMLPSNGWSMLCKIVFGVENNGDMSELEEVGKDIVRKCKHLPLAIKVVGGVLKTTDRTKAAWEKVLSSRTWSTCGLPEEILPSLLLSHEDLPLHLKRCFIYCSLFPQDFDFYRVELPYMWIAEGFIQKEEGLRMEESAEEYYNELLTRNLLLQVTPDHSDGKSKCKMHELLHSLALFVSQNQYIYVDPKTFHSSGLIKSRHLGFSVENMNVDPEETKGKEHLRTLMLSTNTETIPDELLSGLKRLRVLHIKGTTIKTLPDCVGKMRQLRFLGISASALHMLPDSIKNLKNLETLMIDSVLILDSLPKGIVKLENLRHLLMSDRPKNMPNGLDNLKNLRVLDCFVVNDRANMKELKDLSELTDLSIYHLEKVASKEAASEAAMEKKTTLKRLKLHCEPPKTQDISAEDTKKTSLKRLELHCEQKQSISDEDIIEKVLEGIKIPQKLTELSIDGFFGKQLPAHMIGSDLRQLKSLKLERCESLEKVPSLGDISSVNRLLCPYHQMKKRNINQHGRKMIKKKKVLRRKWFLAKKMVSKWIATASVVLLHLQSPSRKPITALWM